jgi:hypothetical protein
MLLGWRYVSTIEQEADTTRLNGVQEKASN